ncbi:rop guanine nucleotide exchange factor 14 isoform X2 [Cryptomeria japonica]|nr:rop guanine nucleotide exchange factor 14 isoform X2 [Cryptomeria japonica]
MHRLGCCRRDKGLSLDLEEDGGKMMNMGMVDGVFKSWSMDSGGFCTDSLSLEEDDSSCSSSKDGFGSFSTARWSVRRLPEDQCHEELLEVPSPEEYKCVLDEKTTHHMEWDDVNMMKERFAKLLLGEDMSGGSKGVSTALALSNAITNLSASVFGELWRLEPLAEERKAKWCREMDWLLSPANFMVELVPARQSYSNGRSIEIMTPRPRSDIHINLPALRKLDAMLIESLDSLGQTEFWYAEGGNEGMNDLHSVSMTHGKKWWLPVPKVPLNGLSDEARKKLLYQRDCINQIFKAAKSINEQILSEMEVPEVFWDTLPKTGKSSLGDALYRTITTEYLSTESVLSSLDLSTEHNALEMANRLESAIYAWKRRIQGRQSISFEEGKTGVRSPWSLVKESEAELVKKELYMERAENILLHLKNKFPSIPQTFLDITKIQYNRDVGHSILESYSRVLESLAFNILSRIGDVIREDDLVKSSQSSPPALSCIDDESMISSKSRNLDERCPFPSESPSPTSPIRTPQSRQHHQADATQIGEALINFINRESCFSESDYKDAREEIASVSGKNSASPISPRLANIWCYGREVCSSVSCPNSP